MLRAQKSETDFQTNFDHLLFQPVSLGSLVVNTQQHQENVHPQNEQAAHSAVTKAVHRTVPQFKMTYSQRIKYEVSHFVLESIQQICSKEQNLPATLQIEQRKALAFIKFYESQVKKPGGCRITRGKALIDLLSRPYPTNNEVGQLYHEAREMDARVPHPTHVRNLERAKRVFQQMLGLQNGNGRV